MYKSARFINILHLFSLLTRFMIEKMGDNKITETISHTTAVPNSNSLITLTLKVCNSLVNRGKWNSCFICFRHFSFS